MCIAGGLVISLFPLGFFNNYDNNASSSAMKITSNGDNVSTADKFTIESNFMRYTGMLQPMNIDDENVRQKFMSASYYDPEIRKDILVDIQAGNTKLGSITLWDNFDQDGDVVEIRTADTVISVSLTNIPQTFLVPYKSGQSLIITGIHDGGGGITAAISTNSGEVPLPPMVVGQSIELPLL